MTPAEIIRAQLGTGTLFMIGAKNLLSFDEGKGLERHTGLVTRFPTIVRSA